MQNIRQKVLYLLEAGGPIAGAAAGGAIGVVSSGAFGAAVGAAVGEAIGQGIEELASRQLSRRETVRVGATAAFAISFLHSRLSKGESPRNDGFFDSSDIDCSAAAEIFDGVLTKAKGDHEERKARFYGHYFANVAFDSTCSRSEANYFLSILDRLTYAQLVIMSLFWNPKRYPRLPQHDLENRAVPEELLHVLAAIFDLCQAGLVKRFASRFEAEAVLDIASVAPARMGLSSAGERLFILASLSDIPLLELSHLANSLEEAVWTRKSGSSDIVLRDVTRARAVYNK